MAQAQAAKEAEELHRRLDAEHEQAEREAQAQAARESEELRRRWEAEYERVELEAEDVRRKSLEETRAREVELVRARFGKGEDVAGAAVYLASEEAAFVSGVALLVDGAINAGRSAD